MQLDHRAVFTGSDFSGFAASAIRNIIADPLMFSGGLLEAATGELVSSGDANIGFGGPHSRVWQWYAGTTDVNLQEFDGNPIFRSLSDEGLTALTVGGVPTYNFTETPWYEFNTLQPEPRNPSRVSPDEVGKTQKDGDLILEGTGVGWFFSEQGGGRGLRPDIGQSRTLIGYDNADEPGLKDIVAVPAIFNGNFDMVRVFR